MLSTMGTAVYSPPRPVRGVTSPARMNWFMPTTADPVPERLSRWAWRRAMATALPRTSPMQDWARNNSTRVIAPTTPSSTRTMLSTEKVASPVTPTSNRGEGSRLPTSLVLTTPMVIEPHALIAKITE